MCIPERREQNITAETTASIPTKFFSTIKISKYKSWIARPGAKSAIYILPCFLLDMLK